MRKPVFARCEPCSLISAFVVHCIDSIIPILAKSKIPRLQLVSAAEQAGLCYRFKNPEDRFSHDMAQIYMYILEYS